MVSSRKNDFVSGLFGRYTRELVSYLTRRTGNRADARDLAQDTYIRLLRVEKVDLIRDPQAYLFRIAANLAYEYQLKKRTERQHLEMPAQSVDLEQISAVTLEDRMDLDARVGRLTAVLNTLPPKHRVALILHRQEGLTYEEIAARMGISVHTVKKYITLGLAQCRARLETQGGQQE